MILDKPTAEHFSRVAHGLGDAAVLRRRELEPLASLIHDGEDVFGLTHGVMYLRTWVVALTNARLILLSQPRLRGMRQIDIALQEVNSIVPATGWLFGSLEIMTSNARHTVDNVPKTAVGPFASTASRLSILCGQRDSSGPSPARPSRIVAEVLVNLV